MSESDQSKGASVSSNAATHENNEQPQSKMTANEAAKAVLKELQGNGRDLIKGKCSKNDARQVAAIMRNKHGVEATPSAVWKAKKELQNAEVSEVMRSVGEGMNAKVTADDDFDGGTPIQKVEDAEGDKGSKSDGVPLGEEEKKPAEPMPIQSVQTICEVVLDSLAETMQESGMPVHPKGANASKAITNETLKAYNASMPKWLLIPITVLVLVVVFVLPARKQIMSMLFKPKQPKPDWNEAAQQGGE